MIPILSATARPIGGQACAAGGLRQTFRTWAPHPENGDYIESIAKGVDAELMPYAFPEMLHQRDQWLIDLLEAKPNQSQIP
ncbi:hypothetical protein VOM14_27515 [Paraburkholderia sp. MPAMCS5]|uniref:hypothetical protein n=1 Tax=Paraburkholderia sp. MPAMCS5 TaxID=3112563 RepID=UPI002E17E9A6|nr:hypothetical protein [Paraburkholderia sp. MPAMCS5]